MHAKKKLALCCALGMGLVLVILLQIKLMLAIRPSFRIADLTMCN